MSEDCLYLNIYTPASALPDSGELLAVMFWIHGGGFIVGEGRNLPVQNLVAFGEVVIVTINYRLGPLGFLIVEGDREVSGNQGLYDQHLALKWVKANIRALGGDAERITPVGRSAGGMSVSYQAMFPDNDGLFRRAIAESVTALSLSAYLTRSQGYAATLRLSRIVGCTDDDKPSLESVRRLDVGEIISKGHMTFVLKRFFLSWASVEDVNEHRE